MSKPKNKITNRMKPWVTEEGLLLLQGWARDGLTNEDIAGNIGINPKTLYQWMDRHEPFKEALRLGKEPANRKVENALFEKATGYTKLVNKVKVLGDGTVVAYEEEIHYPPDTTAQIFWLKNRMPEVWRDKQDIQHSGGLEIADNKLGAILEQLKPGED